MFTNFLLGEVNVTEKALAALHRMPLDLVARHAINEHGTITTRERKQNLLAMQTGDAIISRYAIDPRQPGLGRVVVITQKAWGQTTVQLESEHPKPR